MAKDKKNIIKNADEITDQLKPVLAAAEAAGVKSFVLGFRNSQNQITIQRKMISADEVMTICGFGWVWMLQEQLDNHPEYKDNYRAILKDAIADFENTATKLNKRVAAYLAKNKKSQ